MRNTLKNIGLILLLVSRSALADGPSTSTGTSAVNEYLNSISSSASTGTDSNSILNDQTLLGGSPNNTNVSTSTLATYASTTVSSSGTSTSTMTSSSTLDLSNIGSGITTDSSLNQQTAQQNYQNASGNASQDGQIISLAAIAAGTVMLLSMQTHWPGELLIGMGIAGEAVSMIMANNANTAGTNGANLSNLGGVPLANPSSALLPNQLSGSPSNISIDPSLLTQGKLGDLLSNFEAASGITRGELAAALQSGANIPDLITKNMSPDQAAEVKAGIEGNMPDSSSLNMADILAKTGLSADDLKLKDKNSLLAGSADALGAGGRSPASKGANDLQSLLGASSEAKPSAGKAAEAKKNTKISSELELALRRNGLSNLSLFEIVHSQYMKQSSMMRGIQRKPETFDNPLEAKNNFPAKGM